jgi:type IX secretion system PorP/SprF family membrane protein
LNEDKREKNGILAAGIHFFSDQAGDLKLNTNNVNLNIAYHLIIKRNNTFGLGLHGAFSQRSIALNNERWSNQYDGTAYNNTITGEIVTNSEVAFFDVGAGLLYTYKSDKGYMGQNKGCKINSGLAVYHVNQPGIAFISSSSEKLNMRISAFANASFSIPNTMTAILPGIYYQNQGVANELLVGSSFKFNIQQGSQVTGFNKPLALSLGLYTRVKDAMVAKAIFEYDQYSLGFAYDINLSSLSPASKGRGAFELFLRFNMSADRMRSLI